MRWMSLLEALLPPEYCWCDTEAAGLKVTKLAFYGPRIILEGTTSIPCAALQQTSR